MVPTFVEYRSATVMPFFQRVPGALSKTLSHAVAQEGAEHNIILLIDDGSPIPVEQEVAAAGLSANPNLMILKKSNGGPASARNFGLDHLPDDTEIVAFLDSDDTWPVGHLASVHRAMAGGADFYAADHRREDWAETKFQKIGFFGQRFPELPASDGLHQIDADLAELCLFSHAIQTSAIAVRRSVIGNLRFPAGLSAFEDDIMWSVLGRRCRKIVFDPSQVVINRKALNISLAGEPGSRRSIQLSLNILEGLSAVPKYLDLSERLEAERQRRIKRAARTLRHQLTHALQDRREPWQAILKLALRAAPWMPRSF